MFDNVGKEEIMEGMRTMFAKSFFMMFIGLIVTAITSIVFTSIVPQITMGVVIALAIIEILVVVLLIRKIKSLSTGVATFLFILYSMFTGIMLSSIFICYELSSIIYTFFVASLMFLVMALYGYYTKKDLSKIAPYLLISLIACVIVLIINLFLGNTVVDIIVSFVVIVTTMLVTAYDIHTMKHNDLYFMKNAHVYFAFSLYLDFINIFIYLLRFLGKEK